MKFHGVSISKLKSGETVNGIYVVKDKQLKTASNNKNYIDIIFLDSTGEISGKIWECDEELYNSIEVNKLHYVNAKVDMWKDNNQLNFNKIKVADGEDQKEIDLFVPLTPINP